MTSDRTTVGRRAFIASTATLLTGCSALQAAVSPQWEGVKNTTWTNGKLQIEFSSVDADGFGIRHVQQEDYNDDIYQNAIPEFGGTVTVPLIQNLNPDVTYPSRKFLIVGYEVQGNDWNFFNIIEDTVGDYEFQIPERLMPSNQLQS